MNFPRRRRKQPGFVTGVTWLKICSGKRKYGIGLSGVVSMERSGSVEAGTIPVLFLMAQADHQFFFIFLLKQ